MVGGLLVIVQHTQTKINFVNHVKRSLTSVHACAANCWYSASDKIRQAHDGSARFGIGFLCGHEKQEEEIRHARIKSEKEKPRLQLSGSTIKSYMFVWLLTDASSEYCSSESERAEGKEGTRIDHAAARSSMTCETRNVLKTKISE